MFSTVFMTALLIGGAYGVLLLFHRLSGVDMPEAACWCVKSRYFWIAPVWFIFYLWPCIMLMVLLPKPYTLWNMNLTHTGALLGYAMSDEAVKLYDPVEKQYVTYDMQGGPRAAARFNETFKTVVFYKPFFSGRYQNVLDQGYWASLILIILAAMGVMALYLFTYVMAGEYLKLTGQTLVLSHRMLLDSFRQWTGYPLPLVLGAVTLFIAASSVAGGAMVNRIMGEYEERFQPAREDHHREILSAVAPGRTLKGMIINRVRDYIAIPGKEDMSLDVRERSRRRSDKTVPMAIYTIEFKGLAKYVPVYLSISVVGDPDETPLRKRLDRLFAPGKAGLFETQREREPREMRELDFLVHEDYSVSPAGE